MVRRKQLKRRETTHQWRYLTFSCYGRLPLLGSPSIRNVFVHSLAKARERCGFRLRAWVVMPEHVHILLASLTHDWPIPKILVAIKQPVAQVVLKKWRKLNARILARITDPSGRARFWQEGGGFDRNVRDEDELFDEIAYIHWNPVKRGLVVDPVEWAWSSAGWYAGQRTDTIPIDR